jgi:hypothetical protein
MTDLDPSEANLVADVLSRHWRVKEPAIRTPLGVSRAAWRVGKLYWLAQAEHVRLGELSPQATLLTYLNQYLKVERISLSVPEIIASRAGDLLVDDFGYVWCLTRHLPGFHPAVGDPGATDGGLSWIRINDDAHQYGGIDHVTGDMRTFGTVYFSGSGRGILWGTSSN